MTDNPNIEYERKFLIKHEYLGLMKSKSLYHMNIKQTYLSFTPNTRIREIIHSDGKRAVYTHTIKKNNKNGGRFEKDMKIKKSTYLDLYKYRESIDLYKTRYIILIENSNLIVELDIYDNIDLILAEVEFKSMEDMQKFIPLEWFGKEITDDDYYSIKAMAKGLTNQV